MKTTEAALLGLGATCLIAILTLVLHGTEKTSHGPAVNTHNPRGRPLKPQQQPVAEAAAPVPVNKFNNKVVPGDVEPAGPAPPPHAMNNVNFPKQGKWRPESERPVKKDGAPEDYRRFELGPGPPSFNAVRQGVQKPQRGAHHFLEEHEMTQEVGAMPAFHPNNNQESLEL